MNYMEQDYQKKQIEANQKFLLGLLNFNIGNYYPLRKWLGIDYKGKIDEVSHLSIAYDTKYFKKGKKWFKQQTRVYQQPDLGYKLNWILDSIPEVLVPKVGQPSWSLLQMRLLRYETRTYQPTVKDAYWHNTQNYGTRTYIYTTTYTSNDTDQYAWRSCIAFSIDIPSSATVSNATLSLYHYDNDPNYTTAQYVYVDRLTRTNWTETGVNWFKYDGTNNWTTPGGDFTTTGEASLLIPVTAGAWRDWNITDITQYCVSNSIGSVDLMIRRKTGNSNNDGNEFYSREYTDNTSLRPKLEITYTVPVKDNSIFFSCNF